MKPIWSVPDPRFPEVIDSSMMAAFKGCPQLFKKVYCEDWKPKELSVHLHAGGAFAKGMEVARQAFFTGEYQFLSHEEGAPPVIQHLEPGNAESSIACGLQAVITKYGNFECPADSAKSLERTAGAYEFYWANYPLTNDRAFGPVPITLPNNRRGIEFSFAHPLPILHPITKNPLIYAGRCDTIDHFNDGIYIGDEKTTSSLGPTWSRQWDLRSQFISYNWGCRTSNVCTNGTVVRGVSILKTKYDTQQAIVPCPDWMITQWYEELLYWLEEMKRCWETGVWKHNFDHSCSEYGGCQFRLACGSEDESTWLSTFFERRQWDPITRSESRLLK